MSEPKRQTAGSGAVAIVPDRPSNLDHQIAAEGALFVAIMAAAKRHDADAAQKYADALRAIYRDF